MSARIASPALDHPLSTLGDCLTPESARRVLTLRADPAVQSLVDELASRHEAGKLTAEEEAEYSRYVAYSTFVAILKSKARQLAGRSCLKPR